MISVLRSSARRGEDQRDSDEPGFYKRTRPERGGLHHRSITARGSRFNYCLPLDLVRVSARDARARWLLEAQASIQRRGDIDHVYALEELVPGWGSPESHSS
jgi:hypothetical protein